MVHAIELTDLTPFLQEFGGINKAFNPAANGLPYDRSVRQHLEELTARRNDAGYLEPRKCAEMRKKVGAFMISLRSRMGQLVTSPDWNHVDGQYGIPESRHREAPRTFIKLCEEVLCDPTEKLGFSRKVVEDLGVRECLDRLAFDPRRMARIVKYLGLGDPEMHGKGEDKVAEFCEEKVCEVKDRLSQLEFFSMPHETHSGPRELRLIGTLPDTWEDGTRVENPGRILGAQYNHGQKRFFVTDAPSAERRLLHILNSYESELVVLNEIRHAVTEVHRSLGDWEGVKNEDRREELTGKLLAQVKKLKYVTDSQKRALRHQITEAMTFKTEYGPGLPGERKTKDNPGAARARLVAGKGAIGKRIFAMGQIVACIQKDVLRIQTLIQDCETPFARFSNVVHFGHERFAILGEEPLDEAQVMKIAKNLRAVKAELGEVKYEPYRTFAKVAIERIDILIDALGDEESGRMVTRAQEEFLKLYVIVKLEQALSGVHEVYKKISISPGATHPADVYREVWRLHKSLSNRNVKPNVRFKDFNAAIGEMYHLLNGIKFDIAEALEIDRAQPVAIQKIKLLSMEDRYELYEKLKNRVRDLEVTSLVSVQVD